MTPGEASILLELKDGIITMYHGTDQTVLHEVEATSGMWEQMFDSITGVLYNTPIKRHGFGLVIDGKLCDCRACYAGSVGLTPSAIENWHGRRKCRHNK